MTDFSTYNTIVDLAFMGWAILTIGTLMVLSTQKRKPKRKRTTRKRKTARG